MVAPSGSDVLRNVTGPQPVDCAFTVKAIGVSTQTGPVGCETREHVGGKLQPVPTLERVVVCAPGAREMPEYSSPIPRSKQLEVTVLVRFPAMISCQTVK